MHGPINVKFIGILAVQPVCGLTSDRHMWVNINV